MAENAAAASSSPLQGRTTKRKQRPPIADEADGNLMRVASEIAPATPPCKSAPYERGLGEGLLLSSGHMSMGISPAVAGSAESREKQQLVLLFSYFIIGHTNSLPMRACILAFDGALNDLLNVV